MGELSFLTIIVSLAVCSLLVYGIFQYMKVRLTVLEQSHREQAMILQQYIEESSSDIHRLYQISTARSNENNKEQPFPPNGSIILEYAEDKINKENPVAFNQPHMIHLDTAFFQNKRSSKLIEISSDSENTTESDSESGSDSDDTESESETEGESDTDNTESESESESETESVSMTDTECNNHETILPVCDVKPQSDNTPCEIDIEFDDITKNAISYETNVQTGDIKTITVDLGTIEEPETSKSIDVLTLLYKKAQQTPLPEDHELDENITKAKNVSEPVEVSAPAPAPVPAPAPAPAHVPLSAMSVPDLKLLLKELCKNQPEKHAEIQKLKKPELIYAIKQLQQ